MRVRKVRALKATIVVVLLAATVGLPAVSAGALPALDSPPVTVPDGVRPPQVVTAPTPQEDAFFGCDVAMSGDTMVVGANEYWGAVDGPGRAFVYTRSANGTWTYQATLEATDAVAGDAFGSAVAIEGDTVVVGAPQHRTGGWNHGAVYVFTRSGTVWTPRASLLSTDTSSDHGTLGQTVDISGDTIVAGEHASVPETYSAGAIQVFRGAGASWTSEGRLFAPDPSNNSCFGQAIALDGDTLVVGANQWGQYIPGLMTLTGKAYVYQRTGTVWSPQEELLDPTYPEYARFGISVAVSGGRAFVTVPAWGGDGGHVSVYERSGVDWSHVATLADPAPWSDGWTYSLGSDVAVDGDDVFVSDSGDRLLGQADYCGAVHSFVVTGTDWTHLGKARSVPPVADGQMGNSVALSDGCSAAGWQIYSQEATYAGAVLVWDSLPWPRTSEDTTLTFPAPGVLRNDRDPDGFALTASVVTTPTHGSLALAADGSFVYVPEKDFFGDDVFTYRAYDGSQYSIPTTATISVAPVNDPPVAVDDTYTVAENGSLVVTAPGPLANDTDADGDTLIAWEVDGPSHGILNFDSDGAFTYSPFPGFVGQDTFSYEASDGSSGSWEPAIVTITVTDAPRGPTVYIPVAGTDRFGTCVQASQRAFDDAQTVVIATGRDWPDALVGSALAGAYGGPILLVEKAGVPSVIASEVARLGASRAIIVGGTGAVDNAVATRLSALLTGAKEVTRVAGINRYETARLVAERTIERMQAMDAWSGTVFVATGGDYPDALGASPAAAAFGLPIVLSVPGTGLNAATLASLDAKGADTAYVLGGTGAVPTGVTGQLTGIGVTVAERFAGIDRYETAAKVASASVSAFGMHWDGVAIATGENYADALSGGPVQGAAGSVMLLTRTAVLSGPTQAALTAHKDEIFEVVYLGGTGALNQTVRNAIQAVLW